MSKLAPRTTRKRSRAPSMATKLSQAKSIAQAIGASQPDLGLPCLDLVAVFQEMGATEEEAERLCDDLRSLQSHTDTVDKPPIKPMRDLVNSIESIFEEAAAYRISKTTWDVLRYNLRLGSNWYAGREEVLEHAHREFQRAIETYAEGLAAHNVRVQRAEEEPAMDDLPNNFAS